MIEIRELRDGEMREAIQLKELWVYPQMRNQGASLLLMNEALAYFERLGKKEVIIYNYHHSSSNSYY